MQQPTQQMTAPYTAKASAAAGVVLASASLLEMLAMSHHPSVQTHEISQVVSQISRLATESAVVHGVLISLMLMISYAFADFAAARGPNRPLIRAGAIGYGCGVIVMLGAALVDGFIITGLAQVLPDVTAVDLQITRQLLLLCRVLNQSCANFAVVAMSVGILCWSLDLCRTAGLHRMIGVFGCLVGLAPALALMAGKIHLDVHGMSAVVALQAAWNLTVAALMIARRLAPLAEPQFAPR